MKFKIKRELLLEALNKVSKAISTKNLIPVLAGIKFDLKKTKLTLTASDNDITIQTSISSSDDFIIEKEGSIIIQGKYILDIVRKLPDEFIDIEVIDDLKILISTENSEYNLNGISEKEYPNISLEESKNKVIVDASTLIDIVNISSFGNKFEVFGNVPLINLDWNNKLLYLNNTLLLKILISTLSSLLEIILENSIIFLLGITIL